MMLTMHFISIVGFALMTESPDFYFAKGRFDECKQTLLTIAKLNKCEIDAS